MEKGDNTKIIDKLVVIDDDKIHNFIAKALLDKFEIDRIKVIVNPEEAIKFFEEACIKKEKGICPQIVLLDFIFPSMTATELLEEVHKKGLVFNGHIIVFIISASEIKEEEKKKLRALDVKGFLNKPIKEEDIINALEIYYREKEF